MVSVLASTSDDLSSNRAEAYSFSVQFVLENNENKQKWGQGWPIYKNLQVIGYFEYVEGAAVAAVRSPRYKTYEMTPTYLVLKKR